MNDRTCRLFVSLICTMAWFSGLLSESVTNPSTARRFAFSFFSFLLCANAGTVLLAPITVNRARASTPFLVSARITFVLLPFRLQIEIHLVALLADDLDCFRLLLEPCPFDAKAILHRYNRHAESELSARI